MTENFAFVRAKRIYDRSELSRAALHGKRVDGTSKRRTDPLRTPFNPCGSLYTDDPLNLLAALDGFLAELEAKLYARAPIALHLIVGVSPAWIKETGGLHDPDNPRNLKLVEEAIVWAEKALGGGNPCVVAWRQDLDETGGGLVDLFVSPTRIARMNKRAVRRIVSVSGALTAIQVQCDADYSYAALQTSWADHAKQTLDSTLLRGIPKSQTCAKNIYPDTFAKLAETAKIEGLEKLKREKERLMIRANDWLAAACDAHALGINAFVDGRIAGVHTDTNTGNLTLIRAPDLDDASWKDLQSKLKIGFRVGLLSSLAYLQEGFNRSAENLDVYRPRAG